jgi:phosphate transport system substrate-binding protein
VMAPKPAADGKKLDPVPFARDALVQDSNGAVREIVASDEAAIGYISFGLVDERVRALALAGVMPAVKSIRTGRYPVVRNFLLLTSGPADSCSARFLKYALSHPAQELLAGEGLIPVEQ